MPNAAGLSLTATATYTSMKNLGIVLVYINPVVIKANPDTPNSFLEITIFDKVKKLETTV